MLAFLTVALVLQAALAYPRVGPKPLTEEQVKRISEWKPTDPQASWEMSGQFQGDMILTPDQKNGLVDTSYRWPNNIIPYEFDPVFTAGEISTILSGFNQYGPTCVSFQPHNGEADYVYITGADTGCWSYVGRLGGRQELNLQRNGCVYVGIAAHEGTHAAGFYHQQSATERDSWVTIHLENVTPGYEHNFDKYDANTVTSFGETYDYGSVMHYGAFAFSSNGQATIVPVDSSATIGQRDGLSATDLAKINKMYGC